MLQETALIMRAIAASLAGMNIIRANSANSPAGNPALASAEKGARYMKQVTEHVASFLVVKPVDMKRASGFTRPIRICSICVC